MPVPLFDASGKSRGSVASFVDVTMQRQAADALEETAARFQRFVQTAPIGVTFGQLDGAISYANSAFLQMVGYTREELEAGLLNESKMTPPDRWQRDSDSHREVRERGVCTPYEKEYVRKDGSRVPVLLGASAPAKPWAEQKILYKFAFDMSAAKRTRGELRELAERLRFQVENTPLGVVEIDSAHKIIRFASGTTRLSSTRRAKCSRSFSWC